MTGPRGIDTAETTNTLNRLVGVGERMTTGWGDTRAGIDGHLTRLGGGELGAAFLAGYRRSAAETAHAADQHCRQPAQFAEAGNRAMANYTAIDANGRHGIQSAT
jgi:hypothetical protein